MSTANVYAVDDFMWKVRKCLWAKLGVDAGNRKIDDIMWYISTGRASVSFLHALTAKKPYMVARKLMQAEGSTEETINFIRDYLGFPGLICGQA